MAGLSLYRTGIANAWIDYNGHLRDAYYGLIVSHATDALMDRLGMDGAYREASHCTLYTLETRIRYLHEVMQEDLVEVTVRLLGCDAKRINAAFELHTGRHSTPVASAESLLMHVCQKPTAAAAAFPPEVAQAVEALRALTAPTQPE